MSMMWTPCSSHVYITYLLNGPSGYVFLPRGAMSLRRDHILSVSKTMRKRRSHHLPRPSLGFLVPDQVYLVPNQVVHIPRIGPWKNCPLDPLDQDYNIIPNLTQ